MYYALLGKALMTQAYLYAARVELAELLELTAMLMKKTSYRLVAPTTY